MMRGLAGRVALVTGAANGIGQAVARRFISEGANVAIIDVDEPHGIATADQLGKQCMFVRCDHADPHQCSNAVESVLDCWGQLDVLHNNAGITRAGTFDDTPEAVVRQVLDADLLGPWWMTQAALPALRKTAAARPDVGSVVLFTASGLGLRGRTGMTPYVAAKHAVVGLVRCLALELGPDNIRVNAICPGMVPTAKNQDPTRALSDPQAALRAAQARTPLPRLTQVDDIAGLAAFLASDDARAISAQTIQINNGSDAF